MQITANPTTTSSRKSRPAAPAAGEGRASEKSHHSRWTSLLGELSEYRLRSIKSRRTGAIVYRAHDPRERRTALKVITLQGGDLAEKRRQFRHESSLAMQISHPHLVEVREVFRVDGRQVVAMEYVSGSTLMQCLKKESRWTEQRAVQIIHQLADALSVCHDAGLIHRNLHPDNVVLTANGVAKLIGFGFAQSCEFNERKSRAAATTKKIAQYRAPEQLRRAGRADERSDIYALGALLYALVTGVAPFAESSRSSLLEDKRSGVCRPAEELVSTLSPAVADVIQRSLSVDPHARPQTMEEFAKLLGGFGEKIGGYELVAEVGRGAMGRVHRARTADGKTVALKVLHDHLAENDRVLVRFYQEAKLAMEMSHPNLVPAFEVGCDRGKHFIAMEYIGGKDLKAILHADGRLPEAEALRIAYDVAKALDALHNKGLLHRDVKPGNILFDEQGNARLADLGLAKQEELDYGLTQAGHAMGTMQYAPPEQFRDAKTVNNSADIYALGVTLYQMVTGASPFHGTTAIDQLIRKSRNDYVAPEKIVPGLSEQTRDLIRAAMHEDPAQRPRSAKAFAKAAVGYRRCQGKGEESARGPRDAMWQVVFLGDDGNVQRISGSVEQIRKLIGSGHIGADGRAARDGETSFVPLANIAEFQSLDCELMTGQSASAHSRLAASDSLLRRTFAAIGVAVNRVAAGLAGLMT